MSFRAGWRMTVLLPVTLIGMPMQWAALKLGLDAAGSIPVLYHRIVCRVLGIRRIVTGTPPRGAPALILANHVSWLDISVIGSLVPLSFIAKSEVAGWPFVGFLAKLQRSVFIDRARRRATAEVNGTVGKRLARGEAIVLFAEGTTGDGMRMLPFRSALVGAARSVLEDETAPPIMLQPLSIAYVARDGLPLCRAERPEVAWYGDMHLGPHLMGIFRGGPFDARLTWGEPIPFGAGTDRKDATRLAEARVGEAFREAVHGKPCRSGDRLA